jgi:hypothetical protein
MYSTSRQMSPCEKIFSFFSNTATLLATPAESRKSCALKGASPLALARVFPLFTIAPIPTCRLILAPPVVGTRDIRNVCVSEQISPLAFSKILLSVKDTDQPKLSPGRFTGIIPEIAGSSHSSLRLQAIAQYRNRAQQLGTGRSVCLQRKGGQKFMPLLQVLLVLVVVGVLLWLVNNFIPMAGSIKSILNAVVVIVTVLWLLNIFGLFHSLSHMRVGT